MSSSDNLPLSGVRVLDFTRVLAGPFATMTLADLGADVIKIENPSGGDETRQWGPPYSSDKPDRQSAYFVSVNRNKRSLTLNLRTDEGQQIARELATDSHVLIQNMKVGGMARFGLSYEDLRPLNPKLVYASISGYGQTGPYAQRPGYDYVIQAMSGLMSITGPAEGEPYKLGVAYSDVLTGLYSVIGILSALRHVDATGEGQHIDVSLLDTSVAALVNVISNHLVSGQPTPRFGNAHPNIVPYQTFAASDRKFVLAVGNDGQFASLCSLLGKEHWLEDARFATNPARVENRDELVPLLDEIFVARTANEWVDLLLAKGIPAGPINDIPTIANDPHIAARGLIEDITLEDGLPTRMVTNPLAMSGTPPEVRTPPPILGQHTDDVLRDVLSKSDDEIADLRTNGVI